MELELKATRQSGAESALKIRDLKEEIRFLRLGNDLTTERLDDRVKYVAFLESELRRLNKKSEDEDLFDHDCGSCGKDIDDSDCFDDDDDEFDCEACGMDIDDCTCDDDEEF